MERTTAYEHKEVPITYFGVAYELTPRDQEQFATMRQTLSRQLGDDIYLLPAPALHISITHITAAKDGDAHYKAYVDFYEEHQQEYIATLTEVTKDLSPFKLTFHGLRASSQAIIARAEPSEGIGKIREALAPLPKLDGRNIEPSFVHSTQARYRKSVSLEDIQKHIEPIDFAATLEVNSIQLVRTAKGLVEPHNIIETFHLV